MTNIRSRTRKDGSKSYFFVIDVGYWPDGSRRQQQYTFRKKKDAIEALAKIQVDLGQGTFVQRDNQTLTDYLTTWVDGLELKPMTKANYRSYLKPFITRYGHLPIQKLTAGMVVAAKNEMRGTVSIRTINASLTCLSSAMESARRAGLVTTNVASPDMCPRPVDDSPPVQRPQWSVDDVSVFLNHTREDRWYPVWLLLTCGLRRSEVLGLCWRHVDWEQGTITIEQARTVNTTEGPSTLIGKPKSRNSYRTIPVPDTVLDALRQFKRQQQEERLALGARVMDADLIVCDEAGRPVYPDFISDTFWRLSKEIGLPVIRLHDLRHACASMLHVVYKMPPKTAAEYLGHDVMTHMQVYVHGDKGFGAIRDSLRNLHTG